MQVFENCSVVLELKDLPFKEKKKLKLAITDNGGSIAYVINKQCTHMITNSLANISANRQRSIHKFQVPVVGLEYVTRCLEKETLLPVKEYSLVPLPSPNPPSQTETPISPSPILQATVFKIPGQTPVGQKSRDQPKPKAPEPHKVKEKDLERGRKDGETQSGTYLGKHRVYSENDSDLPVYPSNFEVAKYSIFEKVSPGRGWSVLELQSCKAQTGRQYRVVRHWSQGQATQAVVTRDKLVHCSSSEEALQVYEMLEKELYIQGFKLKTALSPQPQGLGSAVLQQLLLEEKMSSSAVSQEVGVFVELLWTEALGCLGNILKIPIANISLNDVSRAEGLLLQVHKGLKEIRDQKQLLELMEEFYTLLPHKQEFILTLRTISVKLDLCQLIRDMLKVSEATLWNPSPPCLGKYRALGCSIDRVPPESSEFLSVRSLLRDRPLQIQQLFRVSRPVELQMFREDLGNVRSLLHSSAPTNFVGILSRGLLLPRVGVEHHGIERTDVGKLGGGIYFSDSLSTSLKYSMPGSTDSSRLLLVCDVALGKCKHLRKKDVSLSSAPEGCHSVHGLRHSPIAPTDFEDDEYVVYQTDQVRMKYVVQFSLDDEPVKTFQPTLDLSSDVAQQASTSDLLADGEDDIVGGYKNPLEEVTAGLLDNSGQTLPLQAVHVKCKLLDLLTQVIIFQSYTNLSKVPIEAKYVFPLDESAAVCGFEAFVNGKHIVGQVKEKEQARREYRQAIEKGHGAYLMDQDAPDVFTISVGNLPPGATVLIKVTYISELVVRAGSLLFTLPGSVAPWQQSKALNQRTQVSVEKVCVDDEQSDRLFALDMCIQMPYKILDLSCVTHLIKAKKTDSMAVVSMLPGQTLGPGGFQLSFGLSQAHLPRMWVENHPDKDSQACMLVFYPHFDPSDAAGPQDGGGDVEVVILLDTSESMRGGAMRNARSIAVQALRTLDPQVRVNILSFGTVHKELFLSSQSCSNALLPATRFAMSSAPVGGSTELWRPLRSLSLLPPSRGIRNLLLISDGHVHNEALTLKLVRENSGHTRLFTCGLSQTANRHMLRALAQAGGGAYEFFNTKTKHTWVEKVSSQVRRMSCPGCSSVSVKWQQFNPASAPPLQAPAQLHALFSDCHTLVYGFVPHCTQASLYGKLSEQEIETVVSTSELQKTKGTFLHKLTARAVIRDYEDGSLHADEAEHQGKKEELKACIIELSKEYSIVTQYTSFVAIEERDTERPDVGFTDIPELIAEEDVDFLPYMGWEGEMDITEEEELEMVSLVKEILISMTVKIKCDADGSLAYTEASCDLLSSMDEAESVHMDEVGFAPMDEVGFAPMDEVGFAPMDEVGFAHMDEVGFAPMVLSGRRGMSSRFDAPVEIDVRNDLLPGNLSSSSNSSCSGAGGIFGRSFSVRRGRSAPRQYKMSLHTLDMPAGSPPSATIRDTTLPPPGPPPPSLASEIQQQQIVDLDVPPSFCFSGRVRTTPGFKEALPLADYPNRDSPANIQFFGGAASNTLLCRDLLLSAASDTHSSLGYSWGEEMEMGGSMALRSEALMGTLQGQSPFKEMEDVHGIPSEFSFGAANISFQDELLPRACYLPIAQHAAFSQGREEPPLQDGKHLQDFFNSLQGSLFGATKCYSAPPSTAFSATPGFQPLDLDLVCPNRKSIKDKTLKKRMRKGELSWSGATGRRDRSCEAWAELFDLQHQDGYWECTEELGSILHLDLCFFANVFLKEKGISSLGVRAHGDILKLVATLLTLQLIRVMGLPEGKPLHTLFRLKDSEEPTSLRGEAVKRAVEWASRADRQYPCVCTRLEFGRDWESTTRQLLGADPLPAHSPLRPFLERSQ
ncbi:hypothetical protein SKAU_G00260760 [Synaphobranchus kaupii]|uniref:Poly [ADP-ribose] polymerase n=1 Tax=Synaphobranchus kaupii TaxID=118154 RepID=A0A9Q1IRW4_SYNKA|nr:hypothetical protein SKAU_G00260760 [Synaphobranchus kaupii]